MLRCLVDFRALVLSLTYEDKEKRVGVKERERLVKAALWCRDLNEPQCIRVYAHVR